jgi:hypothetical protein
MLAITFRVLILRVKDDKGLPRYCPVDPEGSWNLRDVIYGSGDPVSA